jgi:predicted PurR-regulated permease PerM
LTTRRRDLPWRIVLAALLAALVLAVAKLLIPTVNAFLLLFGAALFGIAVHAVTSAIVRHSPLSHRYAFVVVVVLLFAVLLGGFYYLGSQIADQASEFTAQLRTSTEQLTDRVKEYEWGRRFFPDDEQLQSSVTNGVMPRVMRGLQTVLWGVTGALVILFVGMYLAYEPQTYTRGVRKFVPSRHRDDYDQLLPKLYKTMGNWIIGRLISMAIVGVLTAVGLLVMGVPMAIPLGVIAALLSFIPNVGPIVAAVPQMLIALQVGTNTVLYVLIFNVVLQGIESYLITPTIERYEVTLPPAVTIAAQLILGVLFGVMGVMMAAPLTALAMVVLKHSHGEKTAAAS